MPSTNNRDSTNLSSSSSILRVFGLLIGMHSPFSSQDVTSSDVEGSDGDCFAFAASTLRL